MIEKLKKIEGWPLIIVLAVVIIIAVVLSIVKAQGSKETNVDSNIGETMNQEEQDSEDQETQEEEIIDEESEDEIVENAEARYFIRVNYGQNVVTIYEKDSNGEYTIPYKAMVCSTGTATPRSGTYTMPSSGTKPPRGAWGLMNGNVWAQYFTRITGSILFHSVPYTERNKWSLEYWEYDKLGTAASLGCIRLTVENAKWIYNNCPAGTQVEFYTDSNPGPLVPETPQKISEHEAVRGWDPTDPDASNPWKTYDPDEQPEEPEQPEENNTTTKPATKPTIKPTTPEPTPGEGTTTPEEGTGEQVPDSGEGDGSGEQTPDSGTGEGTGEQTPDSGEGEGAGEQTPDSGTGEGAGEQTPDSGTGEGAGEQTPDSGIGEGSGEQAPDSSEGENSGEQVPDSSEGETSEEQKTMLDE